MKNTTKQMFRAEWNRMISQKELWIVIAIGCCITLWHFYQYVWKMGVVIDPYPYQEIPNGLYKSWIGASEFSMQTNWYYLIFPLIAVLGYAGTCFDDKKHGYRNLVLLRSGKRTYFHVKAFVVFLSGGIAVSIPLLLNFVLTAMKYPALYPDSFESFGPSIKCVGSFLFYRHPLVYILLYLLFDFIIAGLFCVLTMILCEKAEYKFIALLLPFGLHYLLYCLNNFTSRNLFAPKYFLIPCLGIGNVWELVVCLMVGILLWVLIRIGEKRYEAL